MIRVGFLLNFPISYKGGINYFKNLFYALNKFHSNDVKIILFVSSGLEDEYVALFEQYAEIVKTKVIERKSFQWFVSKIGERILRFDALTYRLLLKHQIDVVSHSNYVFPGKNIKSINWIPDFQYFHFPKLWTKKQLKATVQLHSNLIKRSDNIVLSSVAAFNDFNTEYAAYKDRVHVVNFVSQPDNELKTNLTAEEVEYIRRNYLIEGPFFYLPNQFWSHKNHIVVFKAIKILKERGFSPLLVTSGLMEDYRNGDNHILKLRQLVENEKLQNNILFLGLIPYVDVLKLMILSNCIINPSYFEGWSSTVEEAKTIGKRILLSNIGVHVEQNPSLGVYFDPDDPIDLADKMEIIITDFLNESQVDIDILNNDLNKRTKEFASNYYNVLKASVLKD
ncbi:glycosyltransferase family 4 protein [Pedobacter panaciterrae]|uniref:glycosyltransferase family 4 protein n=1 Tax=Pedobacter panaciterrae TaxID=363849 RepID=UPI00155D9216|nr:glycosyltransferase family 1 protein [Pedobacter panaciterrae]NQX55241.1 glycosyltransferase family 4 protein [Pedobacter panaciterrae]